MWRPGNGSQWWWIGLKADEFKQKDKDYFHQGLRLTALRVRKGSLFEFAPVGGGQSQTPTQQAHMILNISASAAGPVTAITAASFVVSGPGGQQTAVATEKTSNWRQAEISFQQEAFGSWEVTCTVDFQKSDQAGSGPGTLTRTVSKNWQAGDSVIWSFCINFHGYTGSGFAYTLDEC